MNIKKKETDYITAPTDYGNAVVGLANGMHSCVTIN